MYLLDADVFIQAKNGHYAFDVVPAFWEWLTQEHEAGRVFTVERCAQEVTDTGDELSEWMKNRPAPFILKPTPDDQPALQRVSTWAVGAAQYRPGLAARWLDSGDYFLVSQGLSLGYTVVTHEVPAPASQTKIKIPDACNANGVAWMNPFAMLRAEGARFTL